MPQAFENVVTVCPGGCDYSTVQAAVDAAQPGDEIRVATGTYTDLYTRTGLTQVVYVSKTLTIRGGYSGDFSAWDPVAYPTILDAGGKGRVIYIQEIYSPTLEALDVTGGSAIAGGGPATSGGGIYAGGASPVISACRVYSNTAVSGAGIVLYGSDNVTLANNVIFSNTSASATGGGVYAYSSDHLTLANNRIYQNRASGGGGVYLGNGSHALITGNQVYSNTATIWHGGGFQISTVDTSTVSNNRVYGNHAHSDGGGALLSLVTSSSFDGNFVYSNTAQGDGGGICLRDSDADLTGTLIRWNTAVSGEGGGLALFSSSSRLVNTVVADNVDEGAGYGLRTAIYVSGSSPQFLHLTLARHLGDGMYINSNGSITSHVRLTNTIVYSHDYGIAIYSSFPDINRVDLATTLDHNNTVFVTPLSSPSEINVGDTKYGDPAFLPDGYHIDATSVARDQGVDAGVTTDIDGDPRLGTNGYDIGADEYWYKNYLPLIVR